MSGEPDETALMAVIAHGLMANVALVQTTVTMLRHTYDAMTDEDREKAWNLLVGQADHIGAVLLDLVRQVPPDAVEALEQAIRNERVP